MNEIRKFEFESHPLTFERRGEEWWANGDEAAVALGYEDKRKVANLYKRHADEFLSSETCVLNLRTEGMQARAVRLYSPKGLEHLAMLGRTETCKRFRRWVLDVIEKLRSGARLVTEEQMQAAILAAVEKVAEQFRAVILDQQATIRALSGAVQTQASSAGKLLSYMSRAPEIRRAIEDAEDERNGQGKFPWGGRLSGLNGGADGADGGDATPAKSN